MNSHTADCNRVLDFLGGFFGLALPADDDRTGDDGTGDDGTGDGHADPPVEAGDVPVAELGEAELAETPAAEVDELGPPEVTPDHRPSIPDGLRELLAERAAQLGIDADFLKPPAAAMPATPVASVRWRHRTLNSACYRETARRKIRERREAEPDSPATFCEKVRVVEFLSPDGLTVQELDSLPPELVSLLAAESCERRGQPGHGDMADAEDIDGIRAAARAEWLAVSARAERQRRRRVKRRRQRYNLTSMWGTADPAAVSAMRAEAEREAAVE